MPIRRTILDELTRTVRSMLAREVPERVLFLTGEAGIGKSTLIKQLLADLDTDAKPPIVATAECSTPVAGSSVGHVEALKPFADIMSGLVEAGARHQEKGAKGKGGAGKSTGTGSGTTGGTGFKLDVGKFFVDTAPSWIGHIPVIGNSSSNQEQVFRQYINFLTKLSAEVKVVIVIDDFHWLTRVRLICCLQQHAILPNVM